jgi:S-disulfanyl-L-cysteine oxidoreductase SoxD
MRRFAVVLAVTGAVFAQSSSVWDGAYTKEQANRGQALYGKHCAGCHGDSLSGGESAPPLAGGEFLSNWNGLTAGDLFERIRTTMPLGKPRLTREVNADILAYMFSFSEFPPGDKDLANSAESLKSIRIDMTRPEKK